MTASFTKDAAMILALTRRYAPVAVGRRRVLDPRSLE